MGVTAANATPRIAPVNSALVAAAASRPIRDPRLLRHQNTSGSTSATASSLSTTINTNVLLESKSSNASTAETLSSNNKNFTNKVSVREHRSTEPRLVASKDNNSAGVQGALNTNISNSKSNKSLNQISPSKKSVSKLSSDSGSPSPTKKSGRTGSKSASTSSFTSASSEGGSFKGSSASSLDSPVKSKSGGGNKMGRSPTTPASKHKKKEVSAGGGTNLNARGDKKKEKPLSKRFLGDKIEKDSKSSPVMRDNSPTTAFKEIRGSKSRNYIRRNREQSPSPEPVSMDVDLRATQAPPEKQPRLQPIEIVDEKGIILYLVRIAFFFFLLVKKG